MTAQKKVSLKRRQKPKSENRSLTGEEWVLHQLESYPSKDRSNIYQEVMNVREQALARSKGRKMPGWIEFSDFVYYTEQLAKDHVCDELEDACPLAVYGALVTVAAKLLTEVERLRNTNAQLELTVNGTIPKLLDELDTYKCSK